MSWLKLLRHDLRCGLLRWRYLLVPALVLLPCIVCRSEVVLTGAPGTWMDYMLYCFKGSLPLNASSELTLALPTFWLLAMAGCLLLNLDYLLSDLTQAGQQIIFRSGKRRGWYLSKCVWNLCSCGLSLALICGSVLGFTLLFGGQASAQSTPEILEIHFQEMGTEMARPHPLAGCDRRGADAPGDPHGAEHAADGPVPAGQAHCQLSGHLCRTGAGRILQSSHSAGHRRHGHPQRAAPSGGNLSRYGGVGRRLCHPAQRAAGCLRFKYTDLLGLEE